MIREHGHTLDIDLVTHRYGSVTAVADVSLAVRAGEIVALLGPSGCGKTTLLRVVAGFVRQSAGSVRIDGKPVDHLPANLRNVGIVFQSYALFPHMTVADNIAYGLQARGVQRAKVRQTVDQFLEVVRLTELRDRLPRQLSGGQQQRVAVARALAVEPTVLLLDEPFSALDKGLRLDMQIEIKRLQRQFGLTAILLEAALSFLGLGVQPPTASWGLMVSTGRDVLLVAPHVATVPGLAIMVAVLGFNLVGDGLRDALDPRVTTTR